MTREEARSAAGHTLLVVEDDPDVGMLLSELFGREGFRVDVACDGPEAILFLEENAPPSVILLDLLIPGILGTSVLEYVESRPCLQEVPVAIVSCSPHLASDRYPLFKKPLRFESLLAFVRSACSAPRRSPARPPDA